MINLEKLLILGAGGHAKVVIHTARSIQFNRQIVLFDDNPKVIGTYISGIRIQGGYVSSTQENPLYNGKLMIAIGDNFTRKRVFKTLNQSTFDTLLHASSVVDDPSSIGCGSVVFAGAILHPGSVVGENVIVNTGSIIEHDCTIESHAQVAPGATLCGKVSVGEASMICAGATVIPGVKIGKNSVVASGAVVTKDVPDNVMVAGVPAQIKKELIHG